MINRPPITAQNTANVNRELIERFHNCVAKKGEGAMVSTHEALGAITEEFHEYVDAVKSNDVDQIKKELYDIMVGCMFALASMEVICEIDRKPA